ncbi:alcohol dehydrogenase catalytic domain-containing protein [Achromobacter xylosoxidans]
MKAIAYFQNLPATDPQSLQDITAPDPVPSDHDLLVEVKAISVNPVDVKIRANRKPKDGQPEIIGWDAAGIVRAVGAKTSLFAPGDRVWYAGALTPPGPTANCTWSTSASSAACRRAWISPRPPRCR